MGCSASTSVKEAEPAAKQDQGSITSKSGTVTVKTLTVKPAAENGALVATNVESGGESKVELALQAKKRTKQQFMGASVNVESNFEKKVIPKTPEQASFIREALLSHFLFASLDSSELNDVLLALELEKVPDKHVIIKEGDKGTWFYLVQKGRFDVTVKGTKVHYYEVKGGFGELALLYDCPRAASVVATEDSEVWRLDRDTFRYTLANNSEKNRKESKLAVSKVELLSGLSEDQLDKVADAVQVFHFQKEDIIIKKGDVGAVFYMIKSGTVKCTDLGISGKKSSDLILRAGEYFGERALMLDEPRAGNVVALEDVTLLALDRTNFENLLGPLRETLDYNLGNMYILPLIVV
jgi:cAMP-dependent protein kinase regulator